jgi:hypothetical protein
MLARELGYASPRRMLREMSPSELGEWLAEFNISPWGEWRADLRVAQNTALLANINRNTQTKPQPYQPRDFMYDYIMEEQDTVARNAALSARIKAELKGYSHKRSKG